MTRLSGLDASMLALHNQRRPMTIAAMLLFDTPEPVRPARIAALLAERASRVDRLRRGLPRPWWQPGARWSDTPDFLPGAHIRWERLSHQRTPDDAAMRAWAAARLEVPLDPTRPPWRVHIATGVPGGGFAVLVMLHHALADAVAALAIGRALFDPPPEPVADAPAKTATAASAAGVRPLTQAFARAAGVPRDLAALPQQVWRQAGEVGAVAAAAVGAVRPGKLGAALRGALAASPRREVAFVDLDVEDICRVRKRVGGTLNDVVLAILTGALRTRFHQESGGSERDRTARVLVPVSVRARRRAAADDDGNHFSGYLCELPTHLADPADHAHAVQSMMRAHRASGASRGAGALALLAEHLPAPVHRLATPLLAPAAPLLLDTMVTTIPFPDTPLSLDGAPVRACYPLAPLPPGGGLSMATTRYRRRVRLGLTADPALFADLTGFATVVHDAAHALHESCG